MLLASKLSVVEARGDTPLLQGALEALAAGLLEGSRQASLLIGSPRGDGVLLGYYQPAPAEEGTFWRRITGGPEARLSSGEWYVGLVFAAEGLGDAVWAGREMARCLGAKVWGATRLGPRRLGAGIVELVATDASDAVRCALELVALPNASAAREPLPGAAERIARAYSDPRWRLYMGAEPLPLKASVKRGDYMVRVGLALGEGRFIATARIDGTFMAAPPNEPFNAIAAVQGMPLGPQALLALEARLAGAAEFYGLEPGDFVEALRLAGGLHDE